MAALEQAKRVWENLLKLGTRRLIGLGVTGLVFFWSRVLPAIISAARRRSCSTAVLIAMT